MFKFKKIMAISLFAISFMCISANVSKATGPYDNVIEQHQDFLLKNTKVLQVYLTRTCNAIVARVFLEQISSGPEILYQYLNYVFENAQAKDVYFKFLKGLKSDLKPNHLLIEKPFDFFSKERLSKPVREATPIHI